MPKSKTRNRCKATLIAAAIAAMPLAAHAAGLGKITVLSALGQPLKAELEVSANRDEVASLSARVASNDAFRQAGIEFAPALSGLVFSREIKERGGRRYIEVSTDRPLNEPFIDVLIELSWASGKLVREYTFLLDPPDLAQKVPAPVTAPEVAAPAKPAAAPVAESRPVVDSRPAVSRTPAKAAAEPAPGKAAEKAPATSAAAAKSHTVAGGETLGKIAAQTKPTSATLDQMLVALFRSNREAFDGGNMNRLRAGKILAIPDAEAVAAITPDDARKEVVAQSADFNAYRKKLAEGAAAQAPREGAAGQSAAGKIVPKVEDKAPAAASGKDNLQVSRTEAGKDGASKQLKGRIATLEEDALARERQLKDANSRVAALEKNLADMKKLSEMKSQAGADLQKQAQAAKPAVPDAKKPEAPAAVKPAEAPKPAEPPKTEPPKPAEAAKPAEPPKEEAKEAPKPAEAEKPAEAPKPKPPAPKKPLPPPPPEPTFMEENGPLVAGGGLIAALLAGWFGFRAYQRKKAAAAEAATPIMPSDMSTHSVFAGVDQAGGGNEHEPSQFSVSTIAAATQPKTVDPVVEADTFLAFGRDAQAEEILLDALKAEPQRHAIHLKLLEIYSARKNAPQFEVVAKDLHAQTGGSGSDWEKAAALGQTLDPDNSLYRSASNDFSATLVLSPEALAAANAPAPEPMHAESDSVAEAVVEPAPEPEGQQAAALDFDLDLDLAAPEKAEAPVVAAAAQDAVALDFDLDLGVAPKSDVVANATALEAAAPEAPVADTGNSIDFDLDLAAPATAEADAPKLDIALDAPTASIENTVIALEMPSAAEAPAPVAVESAGNSIDFDFDLSMPVAEPVAAEPARTEVAAPPLDLGDISLDLEPAPAEPAAAASDDNPADAGDNPEVATKIELAVAYEEMGDREGARELLQEALAEGSPAQKEIARAKLDALA